MNAADEMTQTDDLRAQAIARIGKKREFRNHVMVYLLVNALLVVIWAMTGADFFWPVYPMLGWGIGLFFHAWDVYSRQPSEERIAREMKRIR